MNESTYKQVAGWSLIFFVAFAIALALSGGDFSWRKYQNKQYGFSILFPRSWQLEQGVQHTLVMAKAPIKDEKDKFQENINVIVTELPEELSVSTFFELNKDEILRNLRGAFDVKEDDIAAGLLMGRYLAFSGKMEDVNLRVMSGAWIKGKRVYVITCASLAEEFPAHEPTFKKIMRSLRVK